MVGKTNLTFISKGEASSVQLIQKSYVTGATNDIHKMEVINDNLFVFVDKKYVLTGSDMNNLDFIKRENEKLKATHIVYADETYYIMDATYRSGNKNRTIYATTDFKIYEEIDLWSSLLDEEDDGHVANAYNNAGMFLDSKGNIIVILFNKFIDSTTYGTPFYILVLKSLKEISEVEKVSANTPSNCRKEPYNSFLVNDNIYVFGGKYSLSGTYTISEIEKYQYVSGYFFSSAREKNAGTGEYENILYRSRDGSNKIRYKHELPKYYYVPCIIPINGKLGYLYIDEEENSYLNISDDILGIGNIENQTLQLCDPIKSIKSVLEYNEKTYLGTDNGVIYELQLDFEGTIQRPDVTVIKTLSAKQALAQALQYTDESIKELKNYIDEKIGEKVPVEESSTEVEA